VGKSILRHHRLFVAVTLVAFCVFSACAGGDEATTSNTAGNGGGAAKDGGGSGGTDGSSGGSGGSAAKDGGSGADSGNCDAGAVEICDGLDNDCNGQIDDNPTDGGTYYQDKDGDGYGVSGITKIACEQPQGYSDKKGDCDDNDPKFHPGASETDCNDPNDYNCDGSVGFDDNDGDGYAACKDCDDNDNKIYPGAPEICDGKDDNCNGSADYPGGEGDADGDGHPACADCNDNDASMYPGNTEKCDGKDNDCNGSADFAGGEQDGDKDGVIACMDCDDADPSNFPGNSEKCDGKDNNCNGVADADPAHEVDNDGDGSRSCADCDDNDPNNFPTNTEKCDGKDNNCNGVADADPAHEVDKDGDGSLSCADCNDNDPTIFPGNTEKCDAKDNNCNNLIDEDPAYILCPSPPNASVTACMGAVGCVIQTCSTDWYNTNGTFSDGCECHASPAPVLGNGDTCANAINEGTLADNLAATKTVTGNMPDANRVLWYTFNGSDDADTVADEYHVDVRFLSGSPSGMRMDVYRKGCPGTAGAVQIANTEAANTSWYTDFASTSTGCGGTPAPCGEGNCAGTTPATSQPGKNLCLDDSAPYYVKVYTVGAATCSTFSLEMSNGKY
jgi:Putative metal-binding motif